MEHRSPRKYGKQQEESKIAGVVVPFLKERGWHVERLPMGLLQSGLPDYYISHSNFGMKFLELKTYKGNFTEAQLRKFPILHNNGTLIYIMRGVEDYDLLFGPPNWMNFIPCGTSVLKTLRQPKR